MGSGAWDSYTYTSHLAAKAAAGKSTFDYTDQIRSGQTSAKANSLLDPKVKAGDASSFAGKVMREVVTSDEHPNPTPIAIVLDVTGSNYTAAVAVHAKLPQLFGLLQRKGLIEDPQILIAATGDANSDRVPLQVGQFESDNRIDAMIEAMYLEGFGGGQAHETYELAAYFLARHTYLEPWHKQGRKGYCNTPDAPVWMADGSFKEIGDIMPGDVVMGWSQFNGKRCFKPSRVVGVQHRHADNVVEAVTESGRKIKCTTDHRWLSAHHGSGSRTEDIWTSVIPGPRGGNLSHVLDPTPIVPEDLREEAAWLAGVYDGEGHDLSISQSDAHNPEVCARIGAALTKLGFEWEYRNKRKGSGGDFFIHGGVQARVDLLNKLPITRRAALQWILESRHAKYKHGEVRPREMHRRIDRVVQVNPLPPQEVVSLQTETNNYIAWGFASSNCIFIGDEKPYDRVKASQVRTHIGVDIEADVPTTQVFEELKEQYEPFFLFQKQGSYSESQVLPSWRKLLNEQAVTLEDPNNVCEFIAGLLLLREGGLDLDEVEDELADAGFNTTAIRSASKTLALVGAGGSGGAVAKTDGSLGLDDDSTGADRL